jgi:hypothetical protein
VRFARVSESTASRLLRLVRDATTHPRRIRAALLWLERGPESATWVSTVLRQARIASDRCAIVLALRHLSFPIPDAILAYMARQLTTTVGDRDFAEASALALAIRPEAKPYVLRALRIVATRRIESWSVAQAGPLLYAANNHLENPDEVLASRLGSLPSRFVPLVPNAVES